MLCYVPKDGFKRLEAHGTPDGLSTDALVFMAWNSLLERSDDYIPKASAKEEVHHSVKWQNSLNISYKSI